MEQHPAPEQRAKSNVERPAPGAEPSGEHMCVVTEDGAILAVTEELPRLVGLPLHRIIGSDVRTLFKTADCEGADLAEPVSSKLVRLLTGSGEAVAHLVNGSRMVTRTGHPVMLVSLKPTLGGAVNGTTAGDGTGEVDGVIELESQSALVLVSEDLRVVGWTSGAERLTGIGRESAIGQACWEALALRRPDGTPICSADCSLARSAAVGQEVPRTRARISCPDANRVVELSTISVRLDGRRVILHRMPLPDAAATQGRPRLTARQLDVLELLACGLTTAQIAERLVIERVTAKNHIQRVLEALGCHTRMEAVATARRLGLI